MKKLIALMALVVGLFSTNTFANSVSCYVDTMKYDNYTQNRCFGGETYPNFSPKVVFKVNASKEVARVEWKFSGMYQSASVANCTGTTCIVDVYQTEGYMTACVDKIYYKDYTWADVNWCADAEYMYTRNGMWN
ncbi:hypothetical protein [Pseudoalteromonas phenolica]|uniref:Uncharacterized protein n=1 Tax=Pseudoalteromonas phenolica TaxID=161398 RepID=A0A0S2JX54_9GAMM|nr:hypothetical protein [Pseudoalteromonas phenolica]ALO40698.1 hypothetical protein PP2015_170 [Pseudoalteromonas phenolica]MBE0354786.1 hypothetical protein [Pseudoalteromonas phenolica O-BC30]RXE93495.1 hypothetical protein D9981_20510 [Pseudoalteromonas phenolica O-BC30]TMO54867.1 hypothetical protein CWC21_13190 [Pseudoalteromonas phenolica]